MIPSEINSLTGFTPTTGSRGANESGQLGQQDFLLLMTTQLRNQDPFAPMENGEFLAQMAQFSTVSGLEQANSMLSGIYTGIQDNRISMASTMLGQSVLVPGNVGRTDASGTLHGAVDLPSAADGVVVTYSDPDTGEILHTENLGAQPAGMLGFHWTPEQEPYASGRAQVRVEVTAMHGETPEPLGTSMYARVVAVHTGRGISGVLLDVEDYGQIDQLEISSYR